MVDCYYNMCGTKQKLSFSSPLENGENPELCTSECVDSDGFQTWQSMIGAIQWAISLGRLVLEKTQVWVSILYSLS